MAPAGDEAGARQQPAGEQRFGKRNGQGETPGHAENRKAVGEACAGSAKFFRHPGQRQPGVAQRLPQRRLPAPSWALLTVWGSARSAKIRAATSATILSFSPATIPRSFSAVTPIVSPPPWPRYA